MAPKTENQVVDKDEITVYSKNLSIFRLITNSTTNVILIVCFLILFTQYFVEGWEKTVIMLIALQVGLLIMIAILTIFDYRCSFFYITNKRIIYSQASQRRSKWVDLKHEDVKDIYCSSYNLVIESKDGKKYKLLGISKPNEVLEEIKKIIKLKGN